MGHINLPPTFFDKMNSLEARLNKLENFTNKNKIFAAYSSTVAVPGGTNVPTSVTVTLNPSPFTATPYVQVTAYSTVPGTGLLGVAYANMTHTANGQNGFTTQFDVFVTRNSTTATTVRYLAYQMTPVSGASPVI